MPRTPSTGHDATPASIAVLRARLHLNHSLFDQYWRWVSGFAHGNLGLSAAGTVGNNAQATITAEISGPLVNSVVLAGVTVLILVPLSLGLGVLLATRAGRPVDHTVSTITLAGISLPEFVSATLLIVVFAGWLGWLPAVSLIGPGQGPLSSPEILVLPVLTLLIATLAQAVRIGPRRGGWSRYSALGLRASSSTLGGVPEDQVRGATRSATHSRLASRCSRSASNISLGESSSSRRFSAPPGWDRCSSTPSPSETPRPSRVLRSCSRSFTSHGLNIIRHDLLGHLSHTEAPGWALDDADAAPAWARPLWKRRLFAGGGIFRRGSGFLHF